MAGEYLSEPQPTMMMIQQARPLLARDLVATGLRHRRILGWALCGLLLVAVMVPFLVPRSYEAHLRILVKNARVDPVVSADPNATVPQPRDAELEAQLNSEAEMLKSEELLQRVVAATGLNRQAPSLFGKRHVDPRITTALATRKLAHDLRIEPLAKTGIIDIYYRSSQPKVAADVLNMLGALYLQKHIELHQAPGQYKFFAELAEEYRKQLLDWEAKVADSPQVAPNLLRDMTAQKYNDANATLAQTKGAILETEKRIAGLQNQNDATPARVVTQMHESDNQMLLQQLKSTLLNLQLKRTELLTKFQPTYRPVQEVEKQIRETQAAIDKEETAPAREQTTDQNPTYSWIDSELAKARADLVTLQARQTASQQISGEYKQRLKELEKQSIATDDLQRAATTAKENYQLYTRKAEEARISEALDRSRILNVVIAENATEPLLPKNSRLEYLLVGLFVAMVGAVGLVLAAHYKDARYYWTRDDIVTSLQVPVLAALPAFGMTVEADRQLMSQIRAMASASDSADING